MHAYHSNPDAAEASRIRRIDAALIAAMARDPEGFAVANEWAQAWRRSGHVTDAQMIAAAERTLSPSDLATFRRVRSILIEELRRQGLDDSHPSSAHDV
jgi:hypothetical protein